MENVLGFLVYIWCSLLLTWIFIQLIVIYFRSSDDFSAINRKSSVITCFLNWISYRKNWVIIIIYINMMSLYTSCRNIKYSSNSRIVQKLKYNRTEKETWTQTYILKNVIKNHCFPHNHIIFVIFLTSIFIISKVLNFHLPK